MNETPLDIPAIRKALCLTQSQLADMAGVNLSTVWRWENDGIPKRGPARALLDRLKVEALVAAQVDPDPTITNHPSQADGGDLADPLSVACGSANFSEQSEGR